jgi:murein L,D-transpeptidase YcbB/YkuD
MSFRSSVFRHAWPLVSLLSLAAAMPAPAQQVMPLASQTTTSAQARAFAAAIAEAAAEDEVVATFFRDRGYESFWTAPDAAPRRAALMGALDGAALHGLPAARYGAEDLRAAARAALTEGDRGRLEVALTRAFLAYARDVHSGALVPASVDSGIKREVPLRDARANLDAFSAAASPAAFLRQLAPASQEYMQLMKAKVALEAAMAAGGWGPKVPAAATLARGDRGPAVIALRDRLAAQGYLRGSSAATFDLAIERAVRAFQAEHGLLITGKAGESTITELNRDPEDRLKAVTVALERERWLNIDRGRRHIWVNLADFTAKIVDNGKVTFSTRAVIGDDSEFDKHTPEFSHEMTYMELNPDWTVPPGIIKRDYLPRLQRNPNALGHLTLIDRRGRVVPRGSVNFAAYSAGNFPFSLRQQPGDGNALGKVKFMFPNAHSIYLHDTPHKEHFPLEQRAFSNGCIRLNDPMDFAYALLAAQEDDPVKAFHDVLDSGRQSRLPLADPVPVHLEYRTAFAGSKGRMEYRRDIYGRDARIWAALVNAGLAVPGADS